MIKKIEEIRENPMIAMNLADEAFKAEEIKKDKAAKQSGKRCLYAFERIQNLTKSKVNEQPMETVILEKTIIKLGSLLALGFGEAGANIIAANMRVMPRQR